MGQKSRKKVQRRSAPKLDRVSLRVKQDNLQAKQSRTVA